MRTTLGVLAAVLASLAIPLLLVATAGGALGEAVGAFALVLGGLVVFFAACHGLAAFAVRHSSGHPAGVLLLVCVLGSVVGGLLFRFSSAQPPNWGAVVWVAGAIGVALLLGSAVHYAVSLRPGARAMTGGE